MVRSGRLGQHLTERAGSTFYTSPISGGNRTTFASLDGTRERIEAAGLERVEMVLADHYGRQQVDGMDR